MLEWIIMIAMFAIIAVVTLTPSKAAGRSIVPAINITILEERENRDALFMTTIIFHNHRV